MQKNLSIMTIIRLTNIYKYKQLTANYFKITVSTFILSIKIIHKYWLTIMYEGKLYQFYSKFKRFIEVTISTSFIKLTIKMK